MRPAIQVMAGDCGAGFQPARQFLNLRSTLTLALCAVGIIATTARAETDNARIDRLFMMASSSGIRYQDMVQPAKDSLAAMGETAAIGLARKLNATDARERLALADIYAAIGPVAVPHLIPYLDSTGEYMPKNAARCLTRIADTSATLALIPKLNHGLYAVRSEVATALGKIADRRAVHPLIDRLSDESDSDVRKSCAVALGAIGDTAAAPVLINSLADPFFGVRQSAQVSLTQLSPPPISALVAAVHRFSGIARYGAIVAFGESGDEGGRGFLIGMLQSADPMVRGFAIEGLSADSTGTAADRIVSLKDGETDPFVRAQIKRWESLRK